MAKHVRVGSKTLQIRFSAWVVELIQKRCSTVLGFAPEIVRPKPDELEAPHNLVFQIDRLLASGFKLSGSAAAEIDSTLLLCRKAFGGNR